MTEAPPTHGRPKRYSVAFLTDEWEWEVAFDAGSLERAKAASRQALEALVREESPELACVTLLEDGLKIGVWDWVESQAYWTSL